MLSDFSRTENQSKSLYDLMDFSCLITITTDFKLINREVWLFFLSLWHLFLDFLAFLCKISRVACRYESQWSLFTKSSEFIFGRASVVGRTRAS